MCCRPINYYIVFLWLIIFYPQIIRTLNAYNYRLRSLFNTHISWIYRQHELCKLTMIIWIKKIIKKSNVSCDLRLGLIFTVFSWMLYIRNVCIQSSANVSYVFINIVNLNPISKSSSFLLKYNFWDIKLFCDNKLIYCSIKLGFNDVQKKTIYISKHHF